MAAPTTVFTDRVVTWPSSKVSECDLTRVAVSATFRYRSLDFSARLQDSAGREVARAVLGPIPALAGSLGPDIGDASGPVFWGSGAERRVVGPLTADRTITLSLDPVTVNGAVIAPQDGAFLRLERLDASGHSLTFVNGGPAGGTLDIFGPGEVGLADFTLFRGNWVELNYVSCPLVDLPSGVSLTAWSVLTGVGQLVAETRTLYSLRSPIV